MGIFGLRLTMWAYLGSDSRPRRLRVSFLQEVAKPFLTTGTAGQYDVWCTVKGSGHSGQAGAIRLGISRSLDKFVPGLRLHLKPGWKTHTLFSLAYEAHASRCACLTSTPRPPHYFGCFVLYCDAAV